MKDLKMHPRSLVILGATVVVALAHPVMAEAQEELGAGSQPSGNLGVVAPVAAEGTQPLIVAPAPAPGAFEVDEDDVTRALERALVLEGAQLLPPGVFQIQPNLSYSREEDRTPFVFPLDGGGSAVGERRVERDIMTAGVTLRAGLPRDSQVELTLPYRFESTETTDRIGFGLSGASNESTDGFGDVRLGLSKALLRERAGVPSLIGTIYWDTDSGSRGSGFDEVGATLTALTTQDPLVFFGSFNYEYAFENGDVQPGETFRVSAGTALAVSPETSWRVALEHTFQREVSIGGRRIDGSDETFGVLSVGVSTIVARGTLLDVTAGIGLTDNAPDYSLNISIPIRLGPGRT